MPAQPIVHATLPLEKFPGKGGWTYAALPGIVPDPHSHFGWIRVYGSIDGHVIDRYHLMPMGNGKLFLPVKAAIRKLIGKEAGDLVNVILYEDKRAAEIPIEFVECLRDEPDAYKLFYALPEEEKKTIVDRIYKIASVDRRIQQMANEISALLSLGIKEGNLRL